MTLDELRKAAAKLTPPPGHPMFDVDHKERKYFKPEVCRAIYFTDHSGRSLFGLRDLYLYLCVGAHGWLMEWSARVHDASSATNAEKIEARDQHDKWQRLADEAYELLVELHDPLRARRGAKNCEGEGHVTE